MTVEPPTGQWCDRLGSVVASLGQRSFWRTVEVLDAVGSTQDHARARGPATGDIVVARRQLAGRGRFGRRWCDGGADGVAISLVVEARAPEHFVMRSAVAVASALESLAPSMRFGIKWPNDVLAPDGGKVSGILIERVEACAIIGVGVNVLQRRFPDEIASRARSLAMLGVDADRLEVIERLIVSFDRWLRAPDDEALQAYRERDVLRGTSARFQCGAEIVEGLVVDVDPARGIRIAIPGGERVLSAALATLAVDAPPVAPT